ncbi:phosphatase PAP2 family protein [Spiroplasma sp. TIUS-1]|uniref:phosphatase PAP2 family protein n=1 Tax=Spiroplasma sp. TIUS-1 TaxID=216963 RepID=UPI0013973BF1|nr:phosphatase PAP2 family protein [Spiroplasma sp. TIUS-1]QHX35846.1 phosphatase PAP2 family protein [Spiroplasma sp. TIUS-1]
MKSSLFKKYWPLIFIELILLILLILFGIFDFEISSSFETYKNWLSVGFDVWGKKAVMVPIGVTIIFACVALGNRARNKNIFMYSMIGLAISTNITLALFLFDYKDFSLHNKNKTEIITAISMYIILAICILSFILTTLLINKLSIFKSKMYMSTLMSKVIYAIVFMLITTLIVSVLKLLVGRPRPRDVIGDGVDFKYIFQFYFGQDRGKSFPSGHTQAASLFLVLVYFVPISKKENIFKILFYIIAICSIVLTAISRVLIHAHFPTDVTFSIILSSLCFAFIPKLINFIIKK